MTTTKQHIVWKAVPAVSRNQNFYIGHTKTGERFTVMKSLFGEYWEVYVGLEHKLAVLPRLCKTAIEAKKEAESIL